MKKPKFRIYFRINKTFYSYLPQIYFNRYLQWKDKFETPRVEMEPKLLISWLWFQIDIIRGSDEEYEWWLWVVKYSNNDESIAKSTYPWGKTINGKFEQSKPWINYNK